MDSYLGAFKKLAGAAKSAPTGAEDYFDRLNYVMTPSMLLAVATIVGMKQYVFQPIQCWSVKELDGHRMQYVENYCWVENTFYFDPNSPIPHSDTPGSGKTIYYYQWVPFILMAQAALFYVPHLLWLLLSSNTGIDMRQIASQARKVEEEVEDAGRTKRVRFLANSLLKFLRLRGRYRQEAACRRFASFLFGKPAFAMYLLFAYLLVKCLYIANCVGQLHLMRAFIGVNISTFGFQLFSDILNNRTWQITNVFPRVTYCHVSARHVGSQHPYNIQCVLPVNMLNEKFYILIWFWVVSLLALNGYSLLRWTLRFLLSPSRRSVVKKYLKIAELVGFNDFRRQRSREKEFVDKFLETDGAFVLAVICKNAGDLVASEVVTTTFQNWNPNFDSEEKLHIVNEKEQLQGEDNKPVMV